MSFRIVSRGNVFEAMSFESVSAQACRLRLRSLVTSNVQHRSFMRFLPQSRDEELYGETSVRFFGVDKGQATGQVK